jgi:hypothetical protein
MAHQSFEKKKKMKFVPNGLVSVLYEQIQNLSLVRLQIDKKVHKQLNLKTLVYIHLFSK